MTFYVSLPKRGLIHIEGPDRFEFLQALVTNDMDNLSAEQMVYACLLTPQGKFLHDFFCIWGKDFILLDCEGGERAQDLFHRLNMYRLRKDVQISVEEDNDVYAVFGAPIGLADPRDPEMGNRTFEKPDGIEEKPFEEWDTHRIKLNIPDGRVNQHGGWNREESGVGQDGGTGTVDVPAYFFEVNTRKLYVLVF